MHKLIKNVEQAATEEDKREFYEVIRDIAEHPVVLQMKEFPHHCDTSCYDHCLHVAYYNYCICKSLHLDARSAARAGMLHDLFLYDWRTHARETGEHFHAMTHPRAALLNAEKYFELNDLEREIILKHMWPVTLPIPMNPEVLVIAYTDKYCGFVEIARAYSEKCKSWMPHTSS